MRCISTLIRRTPAVPRMRARHRAQSWLECVPGHAGLADDGLKRADTYYRMVRDWYGDCGAWQAFLHHDVTVSLTHLNEAVLHKNGADLSTR